MTNVITSKPYFHVLVKMYRREIFPSLAGPRKVGLREMVVGWKGYVKDIEDARGAIRQWVRLNASPAYKYDADVTILGVERHKSLERMDGSDRPGNNQSEYTDWGDNVK